MKQVILIVNLNFKISIFIFVAFNTILIKIPIYNAYESIE